MSQHYLVTGGCGFIGSHLVAKLLELKHTVTVLDNLSTGKRENIPPQAKLVVGDIRDQELLYKLLLKSDGCFHLAARLGVTLSQDQWISANQTNLLGTITLFDTAKQLQPKKFIPIVYASSCAIYGDCSQMPLSEKYCPSPISAYGADKLGCELHAKVARLIHEIPNVGLRIFNVYGPNQDPNSPYSGVITRFIHSIQQTQSVEIFGHGEQTRDFIFVKDVVSAFVFFMQKIYQTDGIYNVSTGHSITINHLVDKLSETLHLPVKKHYKSIRMGDTIYSCGNPEKANRLGWHAQHSLIDGLTELYKQAF